MGTRVRLAALGLLAVSAQACALDARDLDAFRFTATGPQKLRVIVYDAARSAALRGEAALRLLDLERPDVDGRALLFQALAALDPPARRALLPAFERGLCARMETPPGAPPSAHAIRAKDAGVRLLPLLEPTQRAALGGAIVRWIGADLERRADAGEFSLEAVAAALGAASASASVDSLRPALSAKALARLTDAAAKHADPSTRAQAAAKVVAIEAAYRKSPAREGELASYALPALGRFADTAAARGRLVAIAADPALAAAERQLALELLASHVTRDDLDLLAQIALDPACPLALRELALARLGETRAADALPTLLALTGANARSLRQPATELAIELAGERALPAIFRTLPSQWNVRYAKSELEAYAARVQALPVTPSLTAQLSGKLYSIFFWNRVIAIRYFAHRAQPLEATWRLRLHVDDKQEILGEGWPEKWTIGREAREALAVVAAREAAQR